MSIFKEHKTSADRSASDRRRHKEKIDKAIKEGIYDIVADESIIGQDGKKKIRIPVRGIKEYKFVYGDNGNKKVGSAPGKSVKRGQKVGSKPEQQAPGDRAGDEQGEEYYDVEITLEELAHYLFDNLELPELEKKRFKKLLTEKPKRKGYRSWGIRPRLDKKETVKKMLRRKNASKRAGALEEDESFPFNEKDLRYKHIKNKPRYHSNAVIFFIMDISGSMTQNKKYLARSFFFLLYHFIRSRYENTELVFIAHDTQAYEVSEDQFFKRGSGGGTIVSSAVEMVSDIMVRRFHPDSWNVYVFQCSDGDNWPSDNVKLVNLLTSLKEKTQLYGYCEVTPQENNLNWTKESTLAHDLTFLKDSSFRISFISTPQDVWPAFNTFFGGKLANV
tara:strand:+ start:3871 stop:5037 length:1167 start_codon:yes stop_codon:yes gene_type:complete